MNNKKQKKEALNYVQSIFYPSVNDLISEFKLPVQKFVKQMIFGIIKSRSVIAQQIGISLEEDLKLKKTCERLYRNLKEISFLHLFLMVSHMRKTSSIIQETTPIFIDLSDIAKTAAEKMEGLAKVWDGSEGKTNKGYFTLQASFCDPENPRSIHLYYCINTNNRELTPERIFYRHSTKMGMENRFKDLLIDFNLHHPRMRSLSANRLYCQVVMLVYNLIKAIQYLKLKGHDFFLSIRSFILKFIIIPGKLVKHSGRRILKLPYFPGGEHLLNDLTR